MLYIVSTPIGNLKDITLRAIDVLKQMDFIAAEDTRRTSLLCRHYQIDTPLTSYYEDRQEKKTEYLIKLLTEGKNVALVSDAGTPGISDPGYRLIQQAKDKNIPITVVPGPSAFLAALSASGLPMNRFVFEGFLPVKMQERRRRLEAYKDEERTIIFYESPYRLLKSLKDIQEVLDDPVVVCVRELTKKFEEVKRGRAGELLKFFGERKVKGEIVLLLNLKDGIN